MSYNNIIGELNFDYEIKEYTGILHIPNGSTIYQQVTDIYASGTKDVIGYVTIEANVYKSNNTSFGQVNETFFLPTGTFEVKFLSNDLDGGMFSPNLIYSGQVVGGMGNFLGSVGTADVVRDSSNLVKVNATFNKVWVYPLEVSK